MKIQTVAEQAMKPWPALEQMGQTLELKGGKLFYYDSAAQSNPGQSNTGITTASKPALFLIHGLGDEADTWRHLIPFLCAEGYRIIAPDLPGFGRSAHPEYSQWKERVSINGHIKALMALVQKIDSGRQAIDSSRGKRQVILIGSSMGAFIAQIIACRYPRLVKSLILLGACYPLSGNVSKGMILMGLPFIGKTRYRGFQRDHEAAWKSLYPYYYDLDAMDSSDRDFLRCRVVDRVESPGQEKAYFASLRSLIRMHIFAGNKFTHNTRVYPGKILLLWGESDRIMPVDKSAAFRSLRPDADFQLISGSGHLPHQEAPEKTAGVILRFLAG